MTRDSLSPAEARAALDSAGAARAHLATLGMCPPWRHGAFGAVMALLIGGAGFPLPIQMGCTALALAGIALIVSYDRRRYGVFINGYRRGATRPVVAVLLLAIIALLFLQIHLREQGVEPWVPLAVAGAGFVIAVLGSVWWSRVFRREMERGA
jgi:drug/metabolite transporter (DMT)-like permease